MTILRNLSGTFMPHFESRRSATVPLAALSAELVLDVNGDESAVLQLTNTTFVGTYAVQGSFDGTNYMAIECFPYGPGCVGGTLPVPGQPMLTETIAATATLRTLCFAVAGLQKVRITVTAYTSGTMNAQITADACPSISPFVRDQKGATLAGSATAASGSTATLTLAAVPGLRHYVNRISVVRSSTTALVASATPVLVTISNIQASPSTLTMTFGADVSSIGANIEQIFDFGSVGIGSQLINTPTVITCPAVTGVIWRINAFYRLGL